MSIKKFILEPLVSYLYRKIRKGKHWNEVSEDLKLWSQKQAGNPLDSKSFFVKKILYDPKFRTLLYHRVNCGRFITKILPPEATLFIRTATEIAPGGLFLVHPWCTRIGAKRIGKNCVIRHLTTIGSNGKPEMENDTPVLGDNVDIGCMCGIFGNITIGDNVKIGAGTILTKSVPSNSVVVGNPAKIIKKDGERVNIEL